MSVGAAAAVAGTVIFFVRRRVDVDEESGFAFEPVVGPNTAGLTSRGRF